MYRMTRRNIAVAIILSLVTCGIYMYYWIYKMAEDINYVKNDPNATSPGLVVVFSILTCGIYFLFWIYKAGEVVDAVRVQQGMQPGSKAILYLILSLLGFSIVAMGLLQNDLNEMADGMGGYGNGGDTRYNDPYAGGYNNQYGDPNAYNSQYGQPNGYNSQYGQPNGYGSQYGQQGGYGAPYADPNTAAPYADPNAAAPYAQPQYEQPQPEFTSYDGTGYTPVNTQQPDQQRSGNPFEDPQN